MIVKQIIDEDFTNYKKPSMYIAFGNCTWKCGKELCHNREIADLPDINVNASEVIKRYLENSITSSIVFGGLEPFDSFGYMIAFISKLRYYTDDDVVIYTGYTEKEVILDLDLLGKYKNIIVKFGRYIANQEKHFDEILGVYLASINQYGKVIS